MNEVSVALVPQRRRRLAPRLMMLGFAVALQGCATGGGQAGYSPEECSEACNKVAGANCGDVGSSCFDSCVSYPNAPYEGDCPRERKAYLDCWWKAVAYECDADERTQPVGCDTERSAHLTCSSGGGGGGAGDGGHGASAGAPEAAGPGVGGAMESAGAAGAVTGGVAGAGD